MIFQHVRKISKNKRALIALIAFLILAGVFVYIFWDLPSVNSLSSQLNIPSVRITDRNGHLLYEIIPEIGGRNAVISFDKIPQCMKDATIAVEDKNFYSNPGVDFEGIVRAVWINLSGGETIAGGSTITQQVAKNLLLSQNERSERTFRRKLREIILAWQLTQKYSKDEILALYLNQVNYGGMAYGVEAASQTYFGKSASDLLLPECALLAGLPQAPGVYNPYTNPDLAKGRQKIVLGLMQAQKYISPDEFQSAQDAPLSYNEKPYPIEAPHFIWLVKDQIDSLIVSGKINASQSLIVRTTLDLNAQQLAESVIKRRIAEFKPKDGEISHNVNNASLVALDPHSGEILALVGSADYFDASIHGALDMATAPRQTGSALKPVIYASALDPSTGSGQDPKRSLSWTAATDILDVTTTFITHDGAPYTPVNYDGREHGPVSVREALASSLNVPAVKTLQFVGIENAIELAKRLGITTLNEPQQYDLSLALGGGQISLLQLSTAYASFANNGFFTGNTSILDIRDADGNLIYTQQKNPPQQIFDARVAWLINDILSDDEARSIGFGFNSTLKIDRTAAVKTGTTTNFTDNWAIGYTPDLLVGVWVGNSGHEAMHNVTGLTGAAPIWNEVLRSLLQGKPDKAFQKPDGLNQVEVCALSGLLPTSICPHTKMEWFIAGTEPTQPDTFYRQIFIDSLTGLPADNSTPLDQKKSIIVLDLPVEAQKWARTQGLPLLSDFSSRSNSTQTDSLALISPRTNTTYKIDSNFNQSAQQLSIEAVAGQGISQITFWVDGNQLASFSSAPYQTWWTLSAGEHRFWAQGVDGNGEVVKSDVVTINVLAGN